MWKVLSDFAFPSLWHNSSTALTSAMQAPWRLQREQMTLALHPTLGVDEWVPEGQIFRCNLCIKIRHQHQLRNTLRHSLSFEGLKCLLSTPQSACSDMSTNIIPVAELSEKLWRAVTALFEYPVLSTGGEHLRFRSHLLLDSKASLSLGQIFKAFRYS